MADVVVDLLPRDAELATAGAGGDGAAFVRLYDHYSDEVFEASLQATGSIEGAAAATQRAFLRILRWPPPLGAPDGDVAELLFALAFGGERVPAPATPDTVDARKIARLVGVGWLRSETVAKAGARFDADWSVYLWNDSPAAESAARRLGEGPSAAAALALPRLALPRPALPSAGRRRSRGRAGARRDGRRHGLLPGRDRSDGRSARGRDRQVGGRLTQGPRAATGSAPPLPRRTHARPERLKPLLAP